MDKQNRPRQGTKRRLLFDLLLRPGGATQSELNQASGWEAFSYASHARRIVRDYGGILRVEGVGQTKRYWIE